MVRDGDVFRHQPFAHFPPNLITDSMVALWIAGRGSGEDTGMDRKTEFAKVRIYAITEARGVYRYDGWSKLGGCRLKQIAYFESQLGGV